jgi:hypothetical protein
MLKNNNNKCIQYRSILEHIIGDKNENIPNNGLDTTWEPTQNPRGINMKNLEANSGSIWA